jgi:Condensation domain
MVLSGYDISSFRQAVYSVVARHEILRTVFRECEGEVRQWVLSTEDSGFAIQEIDFSGSVAPDQSIIDYIKEDSLVAFDLEKGPLLRAVFLRLSETDYVFYYNMHHIISDGWSMGVLSRDVLSYYNHYRSGSVELLPVLRIQYKDYAAWQLSLLDDASFKEHRAYWLGHLSGELPLLTLPFSGPRPLVQTHRGHNLRMFSQDLKSFSQEHGGTLFMGLLTSLNVLLYRYTGQEDLILGTPVAGREHSDLEDQIGFYVNTLALRNSIAAEESFSDLFSRIRENTLNAYTHQGYPFDRLVEELGLYRDTSRSAVLFVLKVEQRSVMLFLTMGQEQVNLILLLLLRNMVIVLVLP